MKILNVCQCTNLGGMEHAALRLMVVMQQRGHSFEVLSLNPLGGLKPLLDGANIAAQGLPYAGRGGWKSFGQVRTRLRESHADGLLMTGPHALTMLALGKRQRGHRVLGVHYHHRGVKPDWQWRLIYRLACRRFQAIVFPSEFVRAEAEEIYPPLRRVSHVIRYPVTLPALPTPAERLRARQALGLPADVPIIGNAGWLIARKRWDVFLHTAARIAARFPDARFVAAGDGPLKNELVALAARLGLQDKVVWLGWRDQLDLFYQSLDVLLFNSDWDTMGLTALEAMSYGVPVAASVQQGGLKEVIVDDRFGLLLNTHDTEVLSDRIIAWLNAPEEARRTGLQGRARVDELGRPASIAAAYEALFEQSSRANLPVESSLAK